MYKPEQIKNSYLSAKNNRPEIFYFVRFIFILLTITISSISSPNLYAQEKGELLKQIEVKNGAVIIDGKYIEPPYLIEARDNGIWINGVQAEKITKRKEQYKKIKEDRIRNEIYAEYFELGEEIGREQARKRITENLMAKKEIKGVSLRKANLKMSDEIEIESETGENIIVKLDEKPTKKIEENMFDNLLLKKYGLWYKATKENKIEVYNNLISFLEKQKEKGRIEDYKFEKDTLMVKYGSFWGKRSDWQHIWSASVEERQLPPDNEADQLDKKDSQSSIEVIANALGGGYLEVFSKNLHVFAGPNGKTTILELKKIITDKNINLEQKKDKIRKVYRPADIEEKYLQEILDNFNK